MKYHWRPQASGKGREAGIEPHPPRWGQEERRRLPNRSAVFIIPSRQPFGDDPPPSSLFPLSLTPRPPLHQALRTHPATSLLFPKNNPRGFIYLF